MIAAEAAPAAAMPAAERCISTPGLVSSCTMARLAVKSATRILAGGEAADIGDMRCTARTQQQRK
jgi:hypothetical protein